MRVIITPGKLRGCIKAIASKSAAHRLLICAALADQPTDIICEELSEDIEATARSLNQLGADIIYDSAAGLFHAVPVRKCTEKCALDVGESGSTLRFLLPVVCALGIKAHILMRGRLPKRPLSPLWEELERHGCCLKRNPDGSVDTSGKLYGGEFRMAAGVSSQFISGLLFALPLLKETSRIRLSGSVESEGYIRMTIRALEQFGVRTVRDGDVLTVSAVPGKQNDSGDLSDTQDNVRKAVYTSPGTVVTDGDWSNGAFWKIADMLTDGGAGSLVCTGLDKSSVQGDRAVRQLCGCLQAVGVLVYPRKTSYGSLYDIRSCVVRKTVKRYPVLEEVACLIIRCIYDCLYIQRTVCRDISYHGECCDACSICRQFDCAVRAYCELCPAGSRSSDFTG